MKRIKSWLGLASITVMKAITGLIVIKSVFYMLGPEVLGQLGQLMTIVAMSSMFAGGGISNGLIQRLASAKNEEEKFAFLGAALSIYIVSSSLVSVLFIIWSQTELAARMLGRQDLSTAIWLLAFSQWLVGAYSISQAIFSGYQKLRLFIIVNLLGPLLGTCLLVCLLIFYHFSGAAYGIVLLPACAGLISLSLLPRVKAVNWNAVRFNLRVPEVKILLSYSFLMLVTASSTSLAQIFVRGLLAETEGWRVVGYWFGVVKISDVYMQFIGILLANYAMPIFSAVAKLEDLQGEIKKILVPLALLAAVALLILYNLRYVAIMILFSKDSAEMAPLFLPQVIGDYLRVIFSVFLFLFIARGHRLLPMALELFQGIGLFVFSYILLARFGVMAPGYAHVLVYTLMLLFSISAYYSLRQGWFIKDSYERIDAVY